MADVSRDTMKNKGKTGMGRDMSQQEEKQLKCTNLDCVPFWRLVRLVRQASETPAHA